MMPLSDDNRGRRSAPIVTWVLIALNVLVFLYQLTLGERELNQFFLDYGVIPQEIGDRQDWHRGCCREGWGFPCHRVPGHERELHRGP
jgi:membrane associated rhomboid family serine protease